MDAIALLKADHKTVETLFRKFEQAGRNAKKLKRKLAATQSPGERDKILGKIHALSPFWQPPVKQP